MLSGVATQLRWPRAAVVSSMLRSMATHAEEATGIVAPGSAVKYSSEFMKAMSERGYLHQCTGPEGLDKEMTEQKITAYLGFDATAKSLHVGSLVQIMILRLLQKTGHTPIVLMGGGTSKVGDPSGKDKARQLLSASDIESNVAQMSKVFHTFLEFKPSESCPNPAILVNNANWLNNLNYIDFLRDYGRYFSVNRMLTFDSVKMRLAREEPLSFLEFNYMILQAYDFKHINEKYGTILQIGGSDQWGNMVSGIELVRKSQQVQLYGLTAPLITTSDGKKMGKSESGAVWLNRDMLSEFDYWQFWRNVADTDVNRFLKLFTELPLDDIESLTAAGGSSLNAAKVVLADEATKILHGEECLGKIHKTIGSLYSGASAGSSMQLYDGDDADDYDDPMDALPEISFADKKILGVFGEGGAATVGIDIGEALMLCRLSSSRKEGRRLIKGGGVKVNDAKVSDEFMVLDRSLFIHKGRLKLSVGKKRHIAFLVPEEVWDQSPSLDSPSENIVEDIVEDPAVEEKKKTKKSKKKEISEVDPSVAPAPKKKASKVKKVVENAGDSDAPTTAPKKSRKKKKSSDDE